jgi:hypothetical protein
MPSPQYEERVVLNFYIVNGRLTSDESVFSGVGWRTPNIAGDPAHYAAQVQISSVLENSAMTAAKEMTELLLDFFPDEHGRVRATEYINAINRNRPNLWLVKDTHKNRRISYPVEDGYIEYFNATDGNGVRKLRKSLTLRFNM